MKGSNIRRAELGNAENILQLYQASIRGLGSSRYIPERNDCWTNRPFEAFAQDIQNMKLLAAVVAVLIVQGGNAGPTAASHH